MKKYVADLNKLFDLPDNFKVNIQVIKILIVLVVNWKS